VGQKPLILIPVLKGRTYTKAIKSGINNSTGENLTGRQAKNQYERLDPKKDFMFKSSFPVPDLQTCS
jgi:hypothetical protein